MYIDKDLNNKNMLQLTNAEYDRLLISGTLDNQSSTLSTLSSEDILKKYPGNEQAQVRLQITGNMHHTFNDMKDLVCNQDIFASKIETSPTGNATITLYTADALHDIDVHLQKEHAASNAHTLLNELRNEVITKSNTELMGKLIDNAPYKVFESAAPMLVGNNLNVNKFLAVVTEHLRTEMQVQPLESKDLPLPDLTYNSTRHKFTNYLISKNPNHPMLVKSMQAYKSIIPEPEFMDIAFNLNDYLALDYHEVIALTDTWKVPIFQETKDLWQEKAHSLNMSVDAYKEQLKLYCAELSPEDLKAKADYVISCELDITNELPWTTSNNSINQLEQARIKHFLDTAFAVRDLPAISNSYYTNLDTIKGFDEPVPPAYEQEIKRLGISPMTFEKRVFSMMLQTPEELLETAKAIKTENYSDKKLLKIDANALEHVVCMSNLEYRNVIKYFYGSEETLEHIGSIKMGWLQPFTLPEQSELRFRDAEGKLDRTVNEVAKATYQEAVDYYKPDHCYYFVEENAYYKLHSISDAGLMRFDGITSDKNVYIPLQKAGTFLPDVSSSPVIKTTDDRYFKSYKVRYKNNTASAAKHEKKENKTTRKKTKSSVKKAVKAPHLQQMNIVR